MSLRTEADEVRAAMQELYDLYYQSRAYEQRYPRPNASTLACVLDAIAGRPLQVLDVIQIFWATRDSLHLDQCGNGYKTHAKARCHVGLQGSSPFGFKNQGWRS